MESGATPSEDSDDSLLRGVIDALCLDDGEEPLDEPAPVLWATSIAAALVGPVDRLTWASAAFNTLGGEALLDRDLVARARAGIPCVATVEISTADGRADTAVFAYAMANRVLNWRLPPEVRAAVSSLPNAVLVLTCRADGVGAPLEAACRAYGLTGLQTRVTLAMIRTGHVKAAAAALGISFHTAREALAQAMRRVRVARSAALVERITSLTFGVLPTKDAGAILSDVWGLSGRQAAVAGLLANGLTRREAARALTISEAVVKKVTDEVYEQLQVGSALALARKVVETQALGWLTHASGGDLGFLDTGAEPLQFVQRPDGSRIAVSDYGPTSGEPVLVSHTQLTTRPLPRALISALHTAGYRPISIDRPGFGLTDETAGARAGEHDPYATAAADVLHVLDALKIHALDVVVRASHGFAPALHAAAADRLKRMVLVNPGMDVGEDPQRHGVFGMIKDAYVRNPAMARVVIQTLSHRLTPARFAGAIQRLLRGSPPDEVATRDPEILRDHFRAQRMFGTGRVAGAVNEQVDAVRSPERATIRGTSNWEVLVGAHDTMHDPLHVLAYWRRIIPDANFRMVEDAGRLMAYSHPHHIVDALRVTPSP